MASAVSTTNTIFDAVILPTRRALASLAHILTVGAAHAAKNSVDTTEYIDARIYEDMLPFYFQVHIMTDTARKEVMRLAREGTASRAAAEAADADFSGWRENKPTWADMEKRVAAAAAILEQVTPADVEARENDVVELGLGPGKTVHPTAWGYAFGYAQPNIFFHLTTAYNILRMKGVPLGKADFIQNFGKGLIPIPQQ